jgi:hypothetical protein
MISDSVKIAKLKARAERDLAYTDLAKTVIDNPVFELLVGIMAITYLNKGDKSWYQSLTGIDLKAGGEFAGLVAIIGLQQIAPLAPSIAQGAEGISKAIPGLLAIAGA